MDDSSVVAVIRKHAYLPRLSVHHLVKASSTLSAYLFRAPFSSSSSVHACFLRIWTTMVRMCVTLKTRTNDQQPRPITDENVGLKILRSPTVSAHETNSEDVIEYVRKPTCIVRERLTWESIVAVHGMGAHPDDTWCKAVGDDGKDKKYINWLEELDMLPAVVSNARIMRYGYGSQWFGEDTVRTKASTISQRLLLALRRERKVIYRSRR